MITRRWIDVLRRAEIWIVWALAACGLAAIPLTQGQSSIIWDALNHHIYLGWVAENPRFDQDFLAANWQSYQYPYLYWPAYKLAISGVSGITAGAVFAFLQSLAAPPLWLVARRLCPGDRLEDVAMRVLACGLAFMGGVTLSLVDTTSNDVLAGIPLVWAVALGLLAFDGGTAARETRLLALSGLLAGIAVACKLSNGPLALILPALWALGPGGVKAAVRRVAVGATATAAGFLLGYGWWGWQMWQQFGNPIYPFSDAAFEPVRAWYGWKPR